MIDPLSIAAIFGPLLVELGKAAIGQWVNKDGFKPATISDFLAIRKSDVELFRAMNEAGGSNASYPWVEAIVRLQRPVVGAVVLGTWATAELSNPSGASPGLTNFASAVGFYLFGDRTLFYARKALK